MLINFSIKTKMNHLRGIYRHIRTDQLYFVEGVARDVTNPSNVVVVYSQQYESVLRGTNTKLPVGSIWIRDFSDFKKKFEKVDQPKMERLITTIKTSLEKDILSGNNLD